MEIDPHFCFIKTRDYKHHIVYTVRRNSFTGSPDIPLTQNYQSPKCGITFTYVYQAFHTKKPEITKL